MKLLIRKSLPLAFFIVSHLLLADTLYLKSGKMIQGTIVEETDQYTKINVSGITVTYFPEQIARREPPQKNGQSENTLTYRVTYRFFLKARADLTSLQFKFPLARRDITGQTQVELETNPKHNVLTVDPDGNQVAGFYFSNVKNGQVETISLSYLVVINPNNHPASAKDVPDTYEPLAQDLKNFLKEEGDIDPQDAVIQQTTQALIGSLSNPFQKAKALYDFITDTITYEDLETDYANQELASGLQYPKETLELKRGNCMAIAKLFIALARAAGIPARQVDGVVFMPQGDSSVSLQKCGHAWTEIYLPLYGWTPVDPTFGITQKEKYFCFSYQNHIREFYGQLLSKTLGSLYRGSSIEIRSRQHFTVYPVERDAEIEIERIANIPNHT